MEGAICISKDGLGLFPPKDLSLVSVSGMEVHAQPLCSSHQVIVLRILRNSQHWWQPFVGWGC